MPSSRAVLRDIEMHGLSPHKAHNSISSDGRLRAPVVVTSTVVERNTLEQTLVIDDAKKKAPKKAPVTVSKDSTPAANVEEKTLVPDVSAEVVEPAQA